MLTAKEYSRLQRLSKCGGSSPRASGKTFRALNEAAQRASIGERVVVFGHNQSQAEWLGFRFYLTYDDWGFSKSSKTMIRNVHSGGSILFQSIQSDYERYLRSHLGNAPTTEIFDI